MEDRRGRDNNKEKMRLNKYLAHCGVCSRRDADRLIEQGRVTVNGAPGEPGMQVGEIGRAHV